MFSYKVSKEVIQTYIRNLEQRDYRMLHRRDHLVIWKDLKSFKKENNE